MNGGQNSASSINNDQLSLIPANGVLSPEEYLRVQQQLDQVKQRIQLVEQNNKIALQKYLAQRAQEGREAERMLAQIRAGEHSQPTATPALPVNPSATVSPDLAYGDGYSATSPVVQTQPTATITEVQSPQQLAQAPTQAARAVPVHNQGDRPQPQQPQQYPPVADNWRWRYVQPMPSSQPNQNPSGYQYQIPPQAQTQALPQAQAPSYTSQWQQNINNQSQIQGNRTPGSGLQTQPREANGLNRPLTYTSMAKTQSQDHPNGQRPVVQTIPQDKYHVVANLLKHLSSEMLQKVIYQVIYVLSGKQHFQQPNMADPYEQGLFEQVTYGASHALQGLDLVTIQQILALVWKNKRQTQQMQSHSAMSSRVPTDASASSLAQEVNGPLQAQRTANATAPASSSSRVLDNSPSIFPTLTQPQAPHQLHSSSSTIHLPPQAMPPASLHRQSPVPASFTSTFHVQQSSSSGVSAAGLLPTPIGSTATRNAAQAGTVSAEAVPNNSTSGMSETRGRGSAAQLGIGVHSPGVRLHPVESLTQSVASSSTAPAQASLSSSSIAHALDTPLIRTTATPSSVVQDASSRTHTPPPPSSRSFSSPTKADTSRLARDILRSLGRPSATSPVRGASPHPPKETPDAKRKRTTESPASPSKKIRTMEVIDLTDVVEEIMTPAVQQQLEETRESQAVPQELRLEDLIRTETIPELPHVRAPSPFVPESAPPTSTPVSPTREYRDLSEPSHDSNVDAVNQFVEVFNRDGRELTYVSANASPARIPTPSGLSYSLLSPEPEHEPTPASAPVERVPLFLPSPASSHGEDVSNGHQNGGAPESGAAGGSFILNTDLLGVAPDLSAGPGPSTVKIRQMKVLSDDEASPTPVRRQRSYSRLVVDFVAVPPLPEWAMRMNAREEELRSVRGSQGTEDEAIVIKDDEEDEERARQEAKQQQVVQLSYSRLRESPCRWRGCDAVLNSADSLGRHVATHVEDDKTSYTCDWHGCAKAFSRKVALLRHLQTHAYIPIFCAYEGCDRSFLTPRELLQHHSSYRHREARLKPSTVPFKHVDAEPIPPLPATLPAYMTEPRRITRHPIPKNTHTWLHKKVLENVTCFYFQGRRPKAAAATRSARLAERSAGEETEPEPEPVSTLELWRRKAQEEYEQFSREQSRRAPQPCGDIPSAEVTRLCDAGLVIWPPEACDSDEEVEAVVALPRDAGAGSNDKIEVDEPAQDDAGSEMREMVETMVGGVEGQPQRAVSRTAGDSSMAIAADGGWPDQSDGRVEQDEPGWTVLRQEEDEDKVEMLL